MLSRHACLQLFALILAACAAPVQLRPTEPQSLAYGEDTASHPHPLDRPAVVLPRRVLPAQNFAHLSIGPKRTNRNDTRTPKQISQDACGGDGHFCKGTAIQHLVGAALGASCTACSVPEFDVDVLDATGCASDSNNGTTFTCGATGSGIGPLLSNEEHVRRLGGSSMPDVTYTGGISQVVKEKSSNVGLDKPIVWTPCAGPDVGYSIEGVLTQVGSCTLAAATNKVTTYSAPTLLTATATCLTATGQFVMNATHTSNTFTLAQLGNDAGLETWTLLQPFEPCSASTNMCSRTEVNNWAPGDSISVWTLPELDVGLAGTNCGSGSGYFGFQHVNFDSGLTQVVGTYPFIVESQNSHGYLQLTPSVFPELFNFQNLGGSVFYYSGVGLGPSRNIVNDGLDAEMNGGQLNEGSDVEGMAFNDDVAFISPNAGGGPTVAGYFGHVYWGAGQTNIASGVNFTDQNSLNWGPGQMNLTPGVGLQYTQGFATTIFQNGVSFTGLPFTFNRYANSLCSANINASGAAGLNCGIAASAANLDKAWSAGGCGYFCQIGGMSINGQPAD